MSLLRLVIYRRSLLHGFAESLHVQGFAAIVPKKFLAEIQEVSSVSVSHRNQGVARFLVERQPALRVVLCSTEEFMERFLPKSLDGIDPRARQERCHKAEARVLSRGPNQDNCSVLYMWKQRVLRGPVETMKLIDENGSLFSRRKSQMTCRLNDFAQIRNTR